ncbi:hypothetical protein Zm00014a_023186 [Zea mays]|uniref:Uncharacterized protein n=2 Tax=Zea mays TaxID=4577 RepID=A0A3L6EJW2_MAIZE|nr:hypothetical protein Zm00014a_023187 [Zea mays]PWZ20909.1 hypothetical protein Zm00014a_023186 [Zea mays]
MGAGRMQPEMEIRCRMSGGAINSFLPFLTDMRDCFRSWRFSGRKYQGERKASGRLLGKGLTEEQSHRRRHDRLASCRTGEQPWLRGTPRFRPSSKRGRGEVSPDSPPEWREQGQRPGEVGPSGQ